MAEQKPLEQVEQVPVRDYQKSQGKETEGTEWVPTAQGPMKLEDWRNLNDQEKRDANPTVH